MKVSELIDQLQRITDQDQQVVVARPGPIYREVEDVTTHTFTARRHGADAKRTVVVLTQGRSI